MSRSPKKKRAASASRPVSTDAMTLYLQEVSRYPRLTRDQEKECSLLIQAGEEAAELLRNEPNSPQAPQWQTRVDAGQAAMETLVNHNLRLVVSIARDFRRGNIPIDDFISAGNEGLIHAARKYDGTLGVPFGNYAPFWIKQRLQKYSTENGFATRIPQYRAAGIHRIMRVAAQMMQELGRPATAQEIANATEYELPEVEEVLRILQPSIELDAVVSDDSTSGEVSSYFGESRAESTQREEEAMEKIDLQRAVEQALGVLTEREAKVLSLYFGLRGELPHDLDQIGKIMGFTRERARQIRAASLDKLTKSGVLTDIRDAF